MVPEMFPTQLDWARLAAYIDGEGSVMINGRHLRVVVSNTDPRLHVWLRHTFGGSIMAQRRYLNPRHSTAMKWDVSCRKAAWVLENCLPFLIIKKQQAEIGLAYQSRLKGPGQRKSLAEISMRADLKDQLTVLNQKGRRDGEVRAETIAQALN